MGCAGATAKAIWLTSTKSQPVGLAPTYNGQKVWECRECCVTAVIRRRQLGAIARATSAKRLWF